MLLISTGWGSVAFFNPAEYHYDPKILAAHRATQEAARALDFGKGFNGVQDLINKVQAQIEAFKHESTLRELTPKEVTQARELVEIRKDVIEGLTYAKKNAGGDLDAEIYEDGDSFNDRWGISKSRFVDVTINGAFGITLGEVTKSNEKRGESFIPKGDVATFDNFYYIFAKDSRRIYDISAFTHSCDGFERVFQMLESKYGAFSKYKPKGRSGMYYRYTSGNREITLRCDKYYGFPMAISYIDKRIKASNAAIEKIVKDVKANFYDSIEKIIKEEKSGLYDNL